jgi:hypothetical protein
MTTSTYKEDVMGIASNFSLRYIDTELTLCFDRNS